jgi:hypothetical protein
MLSLMVLECFSDYGKHYIKHIKHYAYQKGANIMYAMDPYVLLFIIPISTLLILTVLIYITIQTSRGEEKRYIPEKKGVRWQTPKIIRIKQTNADNAHMSECTLLIIKNVGDSTARKVRVWATTEGRELKMRRTKKLLFPPVCAKETGVQIHPNCPVEFIISNINPKQDFWIQWKEEDGIMKSKILGNAEQTTLSLWTKNPASE